MWRSMRRWRKRMPRVKATTTITAAQRRRGLAVSTLETSQPNVLISSKPGASADPEQPPLDAMQALEARFGNEHELADLHSGFLVRGDDVRLHDAGHSRLQRHFRKRSRRAAPRSEHGREVAAAESVHEVEIGRAHV